MLYDYIIVVKLVNGSTHTTEAVGSDLEIMKELAYIQETFNSKIDWFTMTVRL